ncbi:MAG: O-antigen ligase family protein [Proteobacteria bacterium]|nr:O-antigen ligase family protein [Pseudomonadota bacterium]
MFARLGPTLRQFSSQLWLFLGMLVVAFCAITATAISMMSNEYLVAVVLAIGLLFGLVLSGNARLFIFYALVFLAPWNIKRDFMYFGHMGGAVSFDFHISDPFLVALLGFQVRDWLSGYKRPYRFPRTLLPWLILMALGAMDVVRGNFALVTAHEIFRMGRILLWMLVIINEVVRRRLFMHATLALLLAAAVQAGFAVLQVLGIEFGLQNYGEMTRKGMQNLGMATLVGERGIKRVAGVMTHPNILGAYLAVVTGVGLSFLFTPLRWPLKVVIGAMLALFTVIIVLTLSRGGWVDLAFVVVAIPLLTHVHRQARARYFMLRAAIAAGAGIVLVAFSNQIIARLNRSDPDAVGARFDFMVTAWKMISTSPWFGFGLNTYTLEQPPYTRFGSVAGMLHAYGDVGNWPAVHNTWLLVWVEQGTVGLMVWVALHLVIIAVGVRNLRIRDPMLNALNIGLLCGFVAIMLDGMVSFFDRVHQAVVIWNFAALIIALEYWRRANEERVVTAPAPLPANPGPHRRQGWLVPRNVGRLLRQPTRRLGE